MWQLKTPSDLLEVGSETQLNPKYHILSILSILTACVMFAQKVDNKYIAADTTPGLVGGGGTEVWTFKAVGAGSGQLVFTYKSVPYRFPATYPQI